MPHHHHLDLSLTVLGYGNLTPKTDVGKILTIIYALIGIPLMLLYMTNIGHILGSSFKYTYSKICRCQEPQKHHLPTKATLPAGLTEDFSPSVSVSKEEASGSFSRSKHSSDSISETPIRPGSFRQLKSTLKHSRKVSSNSFREDVVDLSAIDMKPSLIVSEVSSNEMTEDAILAAPETVIDGDEYTPGTGTLSVPQRGDSPRSLSIKSSFSFKSRKVSR